MAELLVATLRRRRHDMRRHDKVLELAPARRLPLTVEMTIAAEARATAAG